MGRPEKIILHFADRALDQTYGRCAVLTREPAVRDSQQAVNSQQLAIMAVDADRITDWESAFGQKYAQCADGMGPAISERLLRFCAVDPVRLEAFLDQCRQYDLCK